jgi:hypothetical protein
MDEDEAALAAEGIRPAAAAAGSRGGIAGPGPGSSRDAAAAAGGGGQRSSKRKRVYERHRPMCDINAGKQAVLLSCKRACAGCLCAGVVVDDFSCAEFGSSHLPSVLSLAHAAVLELAGIAAGRYHQGALRVSRFSPFEGWVSSEAVGADILISGRIDMNRAMDGEAAACRKSRLVTLPASSFKGCFSASRDCNRTGIRCAKAWLV